MVKEDKFIVVKALMEYWNDCISAEEADRIVKIIIKICEGDVSE